MLGNRALQAGIKSVTASTTLGYDITGSSPNTLPPDLLTVSSSSATTVTLPSIAVPQYGGLGVGQNQIIRVLNLGSGSVAIAAASGNSVLGTNTTLAQNASRTLISGPNPDTTSATVNVWFSV